MQLWMPVGKPAPCARYIAMDLLRRYCFQGRALMPTYTLPDWPRSEQHCHQHMPTQKCFHTRPMRLLYQLRACYGSV